MLPIDHSITSPHLLLAADWLVLQAAHDSASKNLGRSPNGHRYSDRLARQVLRLFELGHRDIAIIAAVAAQTERAQAQHSYSLNKILTLVPANEQARQYRLSGCGQSLDGYH
ncbi:hypothetical protein GF108_02305 [Phyllobacterium sp. SYP-B3895]|uniref:hypothetical protein n=1 Tax=Phyllobacterium sp. SYP-B3895 TaxID=2663240 RepID=UPI001299573A|nr:hypothetical protein [Phyllobacterium sp. SYP-B3895]MRG54415.1 hypothetical protein [Phyllobacterium sp. SYP-B3895]